MAIQKKAQDIKILNLSGVASSPTDYFIICTGASTRQNKAIAQAILLFMKSKHFSYSLEGEDEGEWILVDLGDVMVHVFLENVRKHYDLESLWPQALRVKVPDKFYDAQLGPTQSSKR